jgi:hypothetical protein
MLLQGRGAPRRKEDMTQTYGVDNIADRFDTYDDAIAAAHAFLADNPIVAWLYVRHGQYPKARVYPDGTVKKLDY